MADAPSTISNKLNFIPKDYQSIREEWLSKLPIITEGRFTNLNESDPGVAILELLASGLDTLLYYQDMQFGELYIPTVRQRGNLISLLRLIGYEVQGVRASVGTVAVSVAPNAFPVYPVTIRAGAQLGASAATKSLAFTTTQDAVITGPTDVKIIPVIQGTAKSETFVSDSSDGQKFRLGAEAIDRTTVKVFINTNPTDPSPGAEWELVPSFYSSTFSDTHFRVESDDKQKVYVIFGDGQFGSIPTLDSRVTVTYFVTDGANGNVGRNAISKLTASAELVYDRNLQSVQLAIVNASATSGGANIETLEHAKEAAQAKLFGLYRAQDRRDYAGLALSVPGVDKAVAWGENEELNPDYRMFNRVRVCIFSNSFADMYSNPASRESFRSLRDMQIRSLLTERMPITTKLVFVDPVIVDVFASIRIAVDTARFDPNIVVDAVRFAITEHYGMENVIFGQDVRLSDLMALINRTEGVAWGSVTRLYTTPADQADSNGDPILDTAPSPPQDLILEKWKLPSFTDTPAVPVISSPTTVPAPYLKVTNSPPATSTGLVNVMVINPDDQFDILINGYSIYTGSNLRHLSISYISTTDEPSPTGGYFGHPQQELDPCTYSSVG